MSGALWGEVTLKNGRVQQSNFTDYRVVRMNESPVIETHLMQNHEKPGGMGEPATACIAPAIANAVYAVTGKRIRQLPLQPALTSVA
jgi:isoquinoline 1-oxidoreductase beta subunit